MYSVIMAGGSGTRFWPRSREGKSKQFLTILGKQSLIQSTVTRFRSFIEPKDIFIVAKKSQKKELEKHVFKVPKENFLFEPMGKNTAPCIGLGALFVQQRDSDGIMVVSPSDHLIQKEANFRKAVIAAGKLASEKEGFITLGIPPSRPSTGYGYIQIDKEAGSYGGVKVFNVKTFAEKPNLATAQRFIKSGDFFWNSGIFIFKASVFLRTVEKFMPDLYDCLMEIRKFLNKPNYEDVLQKVYRQIRSISIDYGIMEKAKNVYLVRGNFVWNDLGSWEQVYKLTSTDKEGNASYGNTVLLDTKNSYIYSSEGVVAVLGLEDVVVVREGDAILVCKRDRAEEVKHIVEKLKRQKLQKYV